jgi:Xaa-Pro aminopeptidase
MASTEAAVRKPIPFDIKHLDRLLDEAGIDVLVATSKHNVQYLLGDYKFFFFEAMDAIGVSRYLPAVVYQKGKPDTAAYVGNSMEAYEKELGKFWPQNLYLTTWTSGDTMRHVIEHIGKLGPGVRRVGIEAAFLPADAEAALRRGLSNVDIVDAFLPLERLRAVKTAKEIEYLKLASERVVESMNAVYAQAAPGRTKKELAEALRVEEVKRGLAFDYCLIAAGTSHNRAPSDQKLTAGDVLSIDSGGNYHGYIGDLARMGIVGNKPDRELDDLLAFVEDVQMQSRKPIRHGALGGSICDVGEPLVAGSPHKGYTHFMAHGMGLVTHEAPRVMDYGPVPYPGYDVKRPLEAGMVLSIETTMNHPKRGLIKIEDTVLVTDTGWEGLGDGVRGWQRTAG